MRNKRKGILMASAILGSAAIVSTGFAAWVITVEDTEDVIGNIEVDKVEDRSHIITPDLGNDLTVSFGMKEDASITNPWLTYEEETDDEGTVTSFKEDFEVTYKFTVTNPGTCDFDAVSLSVTSKSTEVTAAVTAEYITQPSASLKLADDFATSGKGEIVFSFGWGEYFDMGGTNVNPYTFFNNQDATEKVGGEGANKDNTWAKEAYSVLNTIYALDGAGFKVTLQTKAKAN